MKGWISGTPYVELAGYEAFRNEKQPLETAVSFFSDFSQWLPWAVGAIQIALAAQGHEPDPFVKHLPMYLRFGVPTPAAAILSLAGIFDRSAAIALANLPDFEGADLSTLSQKMEETLPELAELDAPTRSVLQLVFASNKLLEADANQVEDASQTEVGTPVSLEVSDRGLKVTRLSDGSEVAYVSDGMPQALRSAALHSGPVPALVLSRTDDSLHLMAVAPP